MQTKIMQIKNNSNEGSVKKNNTEKIYSQE